MTAEATLGRMRKAILKGKVPELDDLNYLTVALSRLTARLAKTDRDSGAAFQMNGRIRREAWEAREEASRLHQQVEGLRHDLALARGRAESAEARLARLQLDVAEAMGRISAMTFEERGSE